MRISIRAPARGATTVSVCAEFSGSNFNPRSREGSDENGHLTRDGTKHFNPRSREGSDHGIRLRGVFRE